MPPTAIATIVAITCLTSGTTAETAFVSHAPPHPLPAASDRPIAAGPAFFIDPKKGDDASVGSKEKPWNTLAHAAAKLRAGDTLYLRDGTYYEHAVVAVSGSAEKPITIRAYPGELAILDGGLREFFETPDKAWEPCPDGVDGEFRSVKTYPDLGGDASHTNVLGNFGDSMIPLQGYRFLADLRSKNPYWTINSKAANEAQGVWCGPGTWYDVKSGRIHIRLAHIPLKGLDDDNYRGETDPRKLRLVIAGHKGGPTLSLRGAKHVRVQDLVVRGSREATVDVRDCCDVDFDGLTVYGGSTAFQVADTHGFRMVHTACRGIAAPWTFRGSLKYRAIEARIFSASTWEPTTPGNRDFELANCEFTDCVDGVFIGNVKGVKFHHNLLDNVSDDGIFLTATTAADGTTPGGDAHIYQNHLSRCLTTFAFGVGHGKQKEIPGGKQTGSGVWIYRNVFDFRRPVHYYWPTGPDAPQEITTHGRFASDHGSPTWEPMFIYHNTILAGEPPRYDYGTHGLGSHAGAKRRVFNNIICQSEGMPGDVLTNPATADYQADGNLFWSASHGAAFKGDFLGKFRKSKDFQTSKTKYPPGWTASDRFADPRFVKYAPDWRTVTDLQLQSGSPALDAGVAVPKEWPDPLRHADADRPDIGAVPAGSKPWSVGVRGRMSVFGSQN